MRSWSHSGKRAGPSNCWCSHDWGWGDCGRRTIGGTFPPAVRFPAQAGCPAPLDEWVSAKPLPLTDFGECPPFPTDVLPAAVGDMVRAVAEATQTDEGMAGGCALTTLGACAGGRIEVHPRPGWVEVCGLYTVCVAPPGERKSPVQAAMTDPLIRAERALIERIAPARLEALAQREVALEVAARATKAAAGAAAAQRDAKLAEAIGLLADAEAIRVPPEPRLLADDVTAEAATSRLAELGRIAVVSAEGRAVRSPSRSIQPSAQH